MTKLTKLGVEKSVARTGCRTEGGNKRFGKRILTKEASYGEGGQRVTKPWWLRTNERNRGCRALWGRETSWEVGE